MYLFRQRWNDLIIHILFTYYLQLVILGYFVAAAPFLPISTRYICIFRTNISYLVGKSPSGLKAANILNMDPSHIAKPGFSSVKKERKNRGSSLLGTELKPARDLVSCYLFHARRFNETSGLEFTWELSLFSIDGGATPDAIWPEIAKKKFQSINPWLVVSTLHSSHLQREGKCSLYLYTMHLSSM